MVDSRLVLFAGMTRSGSTLTGKLLAQCGNAAYVGELLQAIHYGSIAVETCSCGAPVMSCPFWSGVLRPTDSLADMERVYAAVRERTGCDVIVDSSKLALLNARFIRRSSGSIHVSLLHIVRNPRGVRASWGRAKLGRRAWLRVYLAWMVRNVQARWVIRFFSKACESALLRYEDLASTPERELQRITDWAGLGAVEVSDGSFHLSRAFHAVAGNPNRLDGGVKLSIATDDAWNQLRPGRLEALFLGTVVRREARRYGYDVASRARSQS